MPPKRRAPAGVGRPSKGDRHLFATRIPHEQARQVVAVAEYCGVSYSDVLAEFTRMALESDPVIRLPEPQQPMVGVGKVHDLQHTASDYRQFATRIPREKAEQVMALAEYCDVAYNDVLAEFTRMALEHDPVIRLPEPHPSAPVAEQQELSA